MIRHPCCVFNRIDETNILELIDLSFYNFTFGRMDRPLTSMDKGGIRPSVNVMLNNGRINYRHFKIILHENIIEFFKQISVRINLFQAALFPQDDIFFNPWFIQNVDFDGRGNVYPYFLLQNHLV